MPLLSNTGLLSQTGLLRDRGLLMQSSLIAPPVSYDADAQAWISAVETADAQSLETGVKNAMNQLVLDLKSNSIWTAMGTFVSLMGARTLAGALIDVKTPSLSYTNVNFVSGDYNRTTGLVGDGSTKYLNTGYDNNVNSQDDKSLWVMAHTVDTSGSTGYIGIGNTGVNGASRITVGAGGTDISARLNTLNPATRAGGNVAGLIGGRRVISTTQFAYGNNGETSGSFSSQTPLAGNIYVFAINETGTPAKFTNARLRACAVGANHDLTLAQNCMNTYIASITSLGL